MVFMNSFLGEHMQVIKAIFDGANILPQQPIPIKGRYEVVITFLDEVKSIDKEDTLAHWNEVKQMITKSVQENDLLKDDVFSRDRNNRNFLELL